MIRLGITNYHLISTEKQKKYHYYHQGKLRIKQKRLKSKEKKQINALENRFKKNFLDTGKKSVSSLFSKDFLKENCRNGK